MKKKIIIATSLISVVLVIWGVQTYTIIHAELNTTVIVLTLFTVLQCAMILALYCYMRKEDKIKDKRENKSENKSE